MKSFITICALVIVTVQCSVAEFCGKPPVLIRPDECCAMPKTPKEEAIISDCVTKYGEHTMRVMSDYSGEGPIRGTCISECIMNGTGTRDLTPEKLKEMGNEIVAKKPEWAGVPEILLAECSKAYDGKKALLEEGNNLPPLKPDDPHCHPKYAFRMMCEIKTLINNCPAQHRKDSDDCKKMFDFHKTCTL